MLIKQMKKTRQDKRCSSDGFSLLEMAVVLFVVSLLLGGLLMSLSQTQEMNRRNDATAKLDEILDALYGFAQANGRLPCPATVASAGAEAPIGGGACTQQHGFVPSTTLGLSGGVNDDGLLMDDWLGAYRYSVTNANGNAFTTAAGMRTVTMAALAPDLRVCGEAACTNIVAQNLPAVVMSLGADWTAFTGADSVENSGETTIAGYRHGNDVNFVATGYIEDVFDDLISWMSPSILYTRMIAAGQLP
ncbi:MAG: prepilin-type N-terminal cleavage/methylation domain-containing protein [Gammaproteobacteria bacterium]